MKITDLIRSILDLTDAAMVQQTSEPVAVVDVVAQEVEPEIETTDPLLSIIKHLAGIQSQPEYANEPQEITAPIGAAFPSGNDMHYSKNPADIRTNAPSMYPGYQAENK